MPKERKLNGFGTTVLILICCFGLYVMSQLFLIPYNVSLRHKTHNLTVQIEQLSQDNTVKHAQIVSRLQQLGLTADSSQ